ncbi:hypothetical protein ABUR97_03200, partial [Staphylococcus aureus]
FVTIVSVLIELLNINKYKSVREKLFAPGEKATELLFNSKPNTIIMLHNHPGQSSFSLTDLYLFIFNNSIKTLTIVTNKGQTKYLTKTKEYCKSTCIDCIKKYNKNKNIKNSIIRILI